MPNTQIPQLDLRHFAASPAERAEFLEALREAARQTGFFRRHPESCPMTDRNRRKKKDFHLGTAIVCSAP
jgi:isopenicillin N synthase-like dioxygenase